jgi:low affinity Fe/Cu permease
VGVAPVAFARIDNSFFVKARTHGGGIVTRMADRIELSLEALSIAVMRWAGSSWGFALAVVSLLLWAASGPATHYSQNWQMLVNTGTTVVTFLMVFLIQRSQNKDARAIQLKLDELILALAGANNHLVSVETLPEKELEKLQHHFETLVAQLESRNDHTSSHSVGESLTSKHELRSERP